jgi:hypothetical protein
MGIVASPRPLFQAMLAASLALVGGCQKTETSEPIPANDSVASDDGDGDDPNRLAYLVTCAAELEAVAKLPADETEQRVVDENPAPEDVEEEHAQLATLYRGQAKTLASTLGRSDADLTALFKQAEADIVAQRQNRAPDDFAVWVAGEADDCPPI